MWREKPVGSIPHFPGVRKDEAAAVIAGALERGEGWLPPDEIARLFDCYGVPTALTFRASTPEEAAEKAAHVGGPVVLKAVGPLHKTEVGAVRVGLAVADVAAEAAAMTERIEAHGEPLEGFVVQELVSGGVEMLVGMTADPEVRPGRRLWSGRGDRRAHSRHCRARCPGHRSRGRGDGALARDVPASRRLSRLDAEGRSGARGRDPAHVRDGGDQPEIAEVDCNPVIVLDRGAAVVDARVHVRQWARRAARRGANRRLTALVMRRLRRLEQRFPPREQLL